MTDLDVAGRECVSFTVSGEWGHFRRIDTTNDKQTYRVIPRTTVAGLVAAILGYPRDSYYDLFAPAVSAVAVEPRTSVRTMQVPMLTLPTTSGDIVTATNVSGKTVVDPEVTSEKRQRRTFEYLREPGFRLHVVLDDNDAHDALVDRLDVDSDDPRPRPAYTPYLGKSECLARIEDPAVGEVSDGGRVDAVDSTVPEGALKPSTDVSYQMERTPAYMTADDDGRHTTEFVSYAYPTDGGAVEVENVEAWNANGSTVCFL